MIKILLGMFVTCIIGFASALLEPKNKFSVTATFYGLVLLGLIAFASFIRHGHIRIAGWSLTIFLWSIVAFATLYFGGLRGQIPVVFVVVIMFMGSFLGGRAAFILALITIVFLGVVALLDSYNLMPRQLGLEYSPLNAWSGLCIALLLMSILLNNSLTSIKESEERYHLAVRGSGAGLWDWNLTTNEVYYAPGFKEMLGYTDEEFPYTFSSFSDAMHLEDQEHTARLINGHLDSVYNKYDAEFRLRTKSGDYRWFHARGEAVRDSQGKPCRMVGSIVDITKRKLAEESIASKNEELLKINEELDRFVYSASHDLRAPIASLLGLIEVARLEKDLLSVKGLLDMQERSLLKLDKFIFDIVSYSRNNRVDLEIGEINFEALLDSAYDQLQYIEKLKGIKRIMEIDPGLGFFSDQKRITVVMNNLISNAIKYSDPSKGSSFIKTTIRKNAEGVTIHVVDNGEGIGSEHIHRIFEMFYRGSDQNVGSGIGLYIVKEVVKRLRGTVEANSERHQWTEFIVRLPNLSRT